MASESGSAREVISVQLLKDSESMLVSVSGKAREVSPLQLKAWVPMTVRVSGILPSTNKSFVLFFRGDLRSGWSGQSSTARNAVKANLRSRQFPHAMHTQL